MKHIIWLLRALLCARVLHTYNVSVYVFCATLLLLPRARLTPLLFASLLRHSSLILPPPTTYLLRAPLPACCSRLPAALAAKPTAITHYHFARVSIHIFASPWLPLLFIRYSMRAQHSRGTSPFSLVPPSIMPRISRTPPTGDVCCAANFSCRQNFITRARCAVCVRLPRMLLLCALRVERGSDCAYAMQHRAHRLPPLPATMARSRCAHIFSFSSYAYSYPLHVADLTLDGELIITPAIAQYTSQRGATNKRQQHLPLSRRGLASSHLHLRRRVSSPNTCVNNFISRRAARGRKVEPQVLPRCVTNNMPSLPTGADGRDACTTRRTTPSATACWHGILLRSMVNGNTVAAPCFGSLRAFAALYYAAAAGHSGITIFGSWHRRRTAQRTERRYWQRSGRGVTQADIASCMPRVFNRLCLFPCLPA